MVAERNGNGVRIPGWAITAVTLAATLIWTGIWTGLKVEAQTHRNVTVDYRLCRIEKALGVDPWFSCVLPPERRSNQLPEMP